MVCLWWSHWNEDDTLSYHLNHIKGMSFLFALGRVECGFGKGFELPDNYSHFISINYFCASLCNPINFSIVCNVRWIINPYLCNTGNSTHIIKQNIFKLNINLKRKVKTWKYQKNSTCSYSYFSQRLGRNYQLRWEFFLYD